MVEMDICGQEFSTFNNHINVLIVNLKFQLLFDDLQTDV